MNTDGMTRWHHRAPITRKGESSQPQFVERSNVTAAKESPRSVNASEGHRNDHHNRAKLRHRTEPINARQQRH
jgi:hypothetical protein